MSRFALPLMLPRSFFWRPYSLSKLGRQQLIQAVLDAAQRPSNRSMRQFRGDREVARVTPDPLSAARPTSLPFAGRRDAEFVLRALDSTQGNASFLCCRTQNLVRALSIGREPNQQDFGFPHGATGRHFWCKEIGLRERA